MQASMTELNSNSFRVTTSMTLDKAADVFSSLSNVVRLGVLIRLSEREWSVNELAADLRISQSALSQHLSKLRHAKLVTVRRHKQTIFYSCDDNLVGELLNLLDLSA